MNKPFLVFLCVALSAKVWGLPSNLAGQLVFSAPKLRATLAWSDDLGRGVPAKGAEWLLMDNRGRFWLESERDFRLFAADGKYVRTITPLDKQRDFYGFYAMEVLSDGRIVLLERMESLLEQLGKDNFELRSKPGARLVVLKADGKVERDQEEVDLLEPHSVYYLENGDIYSIHGDGSFRKLDSVGPLSKDGAFGGFAAIAYDRRQWEDHVKTLPVFRTESRITHDIKGQTHVEKEAKSFLMGRPLVEGTAPVAERQGKIYYQVVCDDHGVFMDTVFVEDSVRKIFVLIDLKPADQDLGAAKGHALFVDRKGDLFEGVAQKDGYRIYEWKLLP